MNSAERLRLYGLHVSPQEMGLAEHMSEAALGKFIESRAARIGREEGLPSWLRASPEVAAALTSQPASVEQLHEAESAAANGAGRAALESAGLRPLQLEPAGSPPLDDGEIWLLMERDLELAEWHVARAKTSMSSEAESHRSAAAALRQSILGHLGTLRERGVLSVADSAPPGHFPDRDLPGDLTDVPAPPSAPEEMNAQRALAEAGVSLFRDRGAQSERSDGPALSPRAALIGSGVPLR